MLRFVQSPDGEPRFGPWAVRPVVEVLHDVPDVADLVAARSAPLLLAVDGRCGSGKTTVTRRILDAVPGAAVVHTDDVAWYHAMFDWSALITDGVLAPLRRGAAVTFRPPPWDARARPGAVTVPAGCPLVVVDGVGIGRRDLAPFFDGLVRVQTDRALAWARAGPRRRRRRAGGVLARVGGGGTAVPRGRAPVGARGTGRRRRAGAPPRPAGRAGGGAAGRVIRATVAQGLLGRPSGDARGDHHRLGRRSRDVSPGRSARRPPAIPRVSPRSRYRS
jgi:hypothetical protein